MDTLKKKNPFACDNLVAFEPVEHTYTIDGTRCVSVTELIGTKLEEEPPWDIMKERIVQTIHKRTEFWRKSFALFSVETRAGAMKSIKHRSFTDVLWPARYDKYYSQETWRKWEYHIETGTEPHETEIPNLPPPFGNPCIEFITDSWDKTSEDGKILHGQIEMFLNFVEAGDLETVSQIPRTPEFLNFLKFYYSNPNLEYVRTEMVLGNRDIGLCGTADALLRNRDTGEYILVDWKNTLSITSANPDQDDDAKKRKMLAYPFQDLKATKRNKYMIQLNLYAYLFAAIGLRIPYLLLVQCYHGLPQPVVTLLPNITETPEFKKFIAMRRADFESQKREQNVGSPEIRESCETMSDVKQESLTSEIFTCNITA